LDGAIILVTIIRMPNVIYAKTITQKMF